MVVDKQDYGLFWTINVGYPLDCICIKLMACLVTKLSNDIHAMYADICPVLLL